MRILIFNESFEKIKEKNRLIVKKMVVGKKQKKKTKKNVFLFDK